MKKRFFFRVAKNGFWIGITIVCAFVIFFYYHTTVTKNIDPYVYSLPFKKGDSYRVVQGYGGLFSHQHIAAIDFEMPVGTHVYAARGGEIYSYKDKFTDGGISSDYKNKSNYIMIKHDDGSFGCYWHLQKDGVLIKKGLVIKGQLIGLSGATGQVLRPHLHFSVKKILDYNEDSYLKTKFKTSDGIIFIENGEKYNSPND